MGDSDDGIVARSLDYLFKQAARRSSSDGCRYSLRVSFAEIYNEQIYDLILFDKKPLQVGASCGLSAGVVLKLRPSVCRVQLYTCAMHTCKYMSTNIQRWDCRCDGTPRLASTHLSC